MDKIHNFPPFHSTPYQNYQSQFMAPLFPIPFLVTKGLGKGGFKNCLVEACTCGLKDRAESKVISRQQCCEIGRNVEPLTLINSSSMGVEWDGEKL